MPILFTCPYCGQQTNVADEYAGRSGPCTGCGRTVSVPPLPGSAPPAPRGRFRWGVIVAVVLGLFVVCSGLLTLALYPAVNSAREAARRAHCSHNLKQIMLAMHSYASVYGALPPAVSTDAAGKPMHSWRVAIWPFLQSSVQTQMYDVREPWDGPNNSRLTQRVLAVFRCPSEPGPPSNQTSYVRIVGMDTAGGLPNECVPFAKFTDGVANTIAVVEIRDSGIQWAEPKDMTADEFIQRMTSGQAVGAHPGGVHVALGDGAVKFLPCNADPETLRRMLLRNDGLPVDWNFSSAARR